MSGDINKVYQTDIGVPVSHPLGHGTVGHLAEKRDSARDSDGTPSLKALAAKVLARDTGRDTSGTVGEKGVPPGSEGVGHQKQPVSGGWKKERLDHKANTPASDVSGAPGNIVLLRVPKGCPADWVLGVDLLRRSAPLPGWKEKRWRQMQADATDFIENWAAKAHGLGWTETELFGTDGNYQRLNAYGLLPVVSGKTIVALTDETATLRPATFCDNRNDTRFYRRPMPASSQLVWKFLESQRDLT